MAPKLVKVSSLGSLVQQANGNWRVRAQVDGKKYQGPWRATREQAHDDRTKARRATTRLGSLVQQANGNYRVRAQVDGKKYQGPWRTTRKQAHADRTKARRATTRTDFVGIVQSLSRGDRPASSSQPQMPLANMLQASKGKGRGKDRGATEHSVHPKAWEICSRRPASL